MNPVEPDLALVERDLALHQSLQDLVRNLLRNPVERDPALQSVSNLLRNIVEPDPPPAPVHTGTILGCWVEDPISLRCWGNEHQEVQPNAGP